jgi:DNA invertase Pin-like site-specific DNA recombinase
VSGKDVGYIRVSSTGQKTDRQLAGVHLDKIFEDKVSGRTLDNRVELEKCLDYVREGDVLHIHSIDRLARNLRDLQNIVTTLVDSGVTVRFHKDGLVFSGDNNDPMQKLTFQMMGAFAEFEATLIGNRRQEGIEAARRKGKHIGRPQKLSADDIKSILERQKAGESNTSIAQSYGISRTTLYEALKRFDSSNFELKQTD